MANRPTRRSVLKLDRSSAAEALASGKAKVEFPAPVAVSANE
jgi:hypothetical protein